jgi:hypothetical protein
MWRVFAAVLVDGGCESMHTQEIPFGDVFYTGIQSLYYYITKPFPKVSSATNIVT